jgi:NADP-dependent 3-hydroxy acid dehydrogenase YdfG
LAGEGLEVWAAGRNRQRLDEVAEVCGTPPLAFDVTDEAAVRGALETMAEASGPPDLVVNSAGVFDLAPLTETTTSVLDRNLDVNLRGSFHVLRACLPGMMKRRAGLIINVGSVSGRRAFPGNGAYAASKFGLRGLHEVLLEELRGTGVRATLLEPGAVDTPIWDPMEPDADPHLPGRDQMLAPEDVAGAVAFLATLPAHVAVPLLQIERA